MIFEIIIIPIYVIFISIIFQWMRRKIKARLQWRKGPPWYQVFMDLLKLYQKEDLVPKDSNVTLFKTLPLFALATAISLTLFVPFGTLPPLSNSGDLILIIYLLTALTIILSLAGFASSNPYAIVGSRRMIIIGISYEVPIIISIVTVAMVTGSFSIGNILDYQAKNGPLILKLPLSFLTFLLVIPAEVFFNPFSIPFAETEIVEGPFTEYTGKRLMYLELTHYMELFILVSLLTGLFIYIHTPYQLLNVILQLILSTLIILIFIVLDTVTARIRIQETVKFYWIFVTALSIIGLIMAYYAEVL